jgi:hypothetical protein
MQKLKKSLKNNILKVAIQNSPPFFNIESGLNSKLDKTQNLYISKTLSNNFSKQDTVLNALIVSKFKFPLVLKFFKNKEDLNKYLNLPKTKIGLKNTVLTKVDRSLFKNNCYSIIRDNNSYQTFLQMKRSIFLFIELLKLLKFKAKI